MYSILSAPSSSQALGVNLLPNAAGASFRLWAPYASGVRLFLQPNTGTVPVSFDLARDRDNAAYWPADIAGVVSGHLYQFVVQNRGGDRYDPGGLPLLRADPCARGVTSSDPKLPSIVVDPSSYRFSAQFQTPSFEDLIIYQAHVGSFAGRNDNQQVAMDRNGGTANFSQFESKLDYEVQRATVPSDRGVPWHGGRGIQPYQLLLA